VEVKKGWGNQHPRAPAENEYYQGPGDWASNVRIVGCSTGGKKLKQQGRKKYRRAKRERLARELDASYLQELEGPRERGGVGVYIKKSQQKKRKGLIAKFWGTRRI